MKKIVSILVIIIILIAVFIGLGLCVIYYMSPHPVVQNPYKNDKYGFQITLDKGWYVADEDESKEYLRLSDNQDPDLPSPQNMNSNEVIVKLTPSTISEFKKTYKDEKIVKEFKTREGYDAVIISISTFEKDLQEYISFESNQTLPLTGGGKVAKGIIIENTKTNPDVETLIKFAENVKKI